MLDVDRHVERGQAAQSVGDVGGAIAAYSVATRIVNRYGPAKLALDGIAKDIFADAMREQDPAKIIELLVRSLELNPDSGEVRAELERRLQLEPPRRDLTAECLIFPDAKRAEAWYRQAIQTCMDFVVYGGIDGDIYEFGVLAGWTARHFAQAMRDMHYLADLWLFDSFKGLPRLKSMVDSRSYDVTRGVWREEMKLPAAWVDQIGDSIEDHVKKRLSLIISAPRIHVRKGFFSETLKERLPAKAALVHLDCDLHQSTLEVLNALHRNDVLQDGTVLMFDDWNCNRANPAFGQRRALSDWLGMHKGTWAASHFMNYGFNSAAFIVHRIVASSFAEAPDDH